MPRPCKQRRICFEPACRAFMPEGSGSGAPTITLTMDEFEAIRLIDHEGLSQEECALSMNVARTTAQAIYGSARAKLAAVLVNGMALRIADGSDLEYILSQIAGQDVHLVCYTFGYDGYLPSGAPLNAESSYEDIASRYLPQSREQVWECAKQCVMDVI